MTDRIEVRLRFGNGARKRFVVATEARGTDLRALASMLSDADIDPVRSERMLEDAAAADAAEI